MRYKALISWNMGEYFERDLRGLLNKCSMREIDIVSVNQNDYKSLKEEISDADILLAGRADNELLENAKKLGFIQSLTSSVRRIDLNYANDKGITVCNAKGVNAPVVADHTVMLMLILARDYHGSSMDWSRRYDLSELCGKSVCILGVGKTGSEVGKRLRGFDAKLLGIDIFPEKIPVYFHASGTEEDLDGFLERSDYLTIHVPSTERTRGMIDKRRMKKLPKHAYVINMSRDDVVVFDDLYHALEGDEISGAAVDVFPDEPPDYSHPIFGLDNFIHTNHYGGSSREARKRLPILVAENLKRYIHKKELINQIDPEVGF